MTTTTSPRRLRLTPSNMALEPEPLENPPPCSQNITGRFPPSPDTTRPNVEDEAILAGRPDTARTGIRDARICRADGCRRRAAVTLRRARSVSEHVSLIPIHAGGLTGRHEAVLPGRRRSIRDALEDIHAILNQAANLSRGCPNNGSGLGSGQRSAAERGLQELTRQRRQRPTERNRADSARVDPAISPSRLCRHLIRPFQSHARCASRSRLRERMIPLIAGAGSPSGRHAAGVRTVASHSVPNALVLSQRDPIGEIGTASERSLCAKTS